MQVSSRSFVITDRTALVCILQIPISISQSNCCPLLALRVYRYYHRLNHIDFDPCHHHNNFGPSPAYQALVGLCWSQTAFFSFQLRVSNLFAFRLPAGQKGSLFLAYFVFEDALVALGLICFFRSLLALRTRRTPQLACGLCKRRKRKMENGQFKTGDF